jgi:hypothetical protein
MPRNTIQMCPKICASSLQLSDEFSRKRWKTCNSPMPSMAAKIAATSSSTP